MKITAIFTLLFRWCSGSGQRKESCVLETAKEKKIILASSNEKQFLNPSLEKRNFDVHPCADETSLVHRALYSNSGLSNSTVCTADDDVSVICGCFKTLSKSSYKFNLQIARSKLSVEMTAKKNSVKPKSRMYHVFLRTV